MFFQGGIKIPEVECPKGHKEFYVNLEGKNVDGKCRICSFEIVIPYKTVKRMETVDVKCPKCSTKNYVPMIEQKKWISYQKGSRGGTSKKAHIIPARIITTHCIKCGNAITEG